MAATIALAIVLLIALYICWQMVQPFTNVILWAPVLAIVFYPMHRRIRAQVGSPSGAAIVSTVLVVVLILLPATFITIAVVRELAGAADSLQAGVQRLSSASTSSFARMFPKVAANAAPVRPATMIAAIIGPISRTTDNPTRSAT